MQVCLTYICLWNDWILKACSVLSTEKDRQNPTQWIHIVGLLLSYLLRRPTFQTATRWATKSLRTSNIMSILSLALDLLNYWGEGEAEMGENYHSHGHTEKNKTPNPHMHWGTALQQSLQCLPADRAVTTLHLSLKTCLLSFLCCVAKAQECSCQ